MALHKIERLDDYVKFVQGNADELRHALQGHADRRHQLLPRPRAVRGAQDQGASRACSSTRTPGAHIRVWVPACSTGEEAYSMAICLLEFLDETRVRTTACRSSAPTSTTESIAARAPRRLPAEHRARRLARAAAPLLRQEGRRSTRSRGASATWSCSRTRTSTKRPAVLAARSGQLPQPAHLPAAGDAEEGAAHPALRAAARPAS